jgi:putative CocE/NonD family hydrolase
VYVQQANKWRDYEAWPSPKAEPLTLHLRAGGQLTVASPNDDEGSTRYTYDPADPTPSLHGPQLMAKRGAKDMRALAERADTIAFSSAPLDADLEAIGPVSVSLAVRSSTEHTDFYACLYEADRKGQLLQVCDGYLRLRPSRPDADADGVRRITIDCWPTAWRFRKGSRITLIVASGAHPRFSRNLGTGESPATATEMVIAQQEVLHGATAGSNITLSIMPG